MDIGDFEGDISFWGIGLRNYLGVVWEKHNERLYGILEDMGDIEESEDIRGIGTHILGKVT